jgi:hypothetical protein
MTWKLVLELVPAAFGCGFLFAAGVHTFYRIEDWMGGRKKGGIQQ